MRDAMIEAAARAMYIEDAALRMRNMVSSVHAQDAYILELTRAAERWESGVAAREHWHDIASAALAAAEREAWRPIETAPKDGTPLDLWCVGEAEDIDFYCPVHRRHRNRVWREGRVTNVSWRDGAWRPIAGLRLYPLSVRPTHYIPHPVPPAPAPEPSKGE